MQPTLPFDERVSPDCGVRLQPDFGGDDRGVRLPPSLKLRRTTVALAEVGQADLVRHPRARRYVVRVRADGSVRVTIPRWGSKRDAMAFAETQREWIEKQRARLSSERAEPRETMTSDRARELRAQATRDLPARLRELATAFGLTVSRISIRNQRWRWGSCSKNAHICLNWRLVAMPEWVRDYVLIHELMHLKRLDHSPKFWKLVAGACPKYQEARAWLRAYQRA